MTWPALDAQLLADSAATFNFRLGLPVPLAVTPDGAVLFRRTPPRCVRRRPLRARPADRPGPDAGYRRGLLGGGDEHLSDAEKARRERTRTVTRGVVDLGVSRRRPPSWSRSATKFYRDRSRDRHGAARSIAAATRVRSAAVARRHAGRVRACRRSLGRRRMAGGAARRLTHHPEGLEYGVAEFVGPGGARPPAAGSGGRRMASGCCSSAPTRARSTRSTSPTRDTPRSRRCRSSTRVPGPRTPRSTSASSPSRAASRAGSRGISRSTPTSRA